VITWYDIANYGLALTVVLGGMPLFVSMYQFALVGVHGANNHYPKCRPYFPKVSILVPAWNEAPVLDTTIEILMDMDYPLESLRIYIIDDASTDNTPELMKEKMEQHKGNVFHLRRQKGGEGKAHTLNFGITAALKDNWTEALLIMDADVLFEKSALRKMTRHLVDPEVGAVTAYIKEGSAPGNLFTRFIAFEYITAQAASRRAQNVMNFMACLAGGAQLHSKDNLMDIGGKIDTSSLAEDTFTTFKTQLGKRKAIFDGNAIVWAEEPDSIQSVWKQRLRWARGNIQVTRHFKRLWLRKSMHDKLGSLKFFIIWFTIMLMPVFMIIASVGLVVLFFTNFPLSWFLFKLLWILNVITYLFVTLYSFMIDPESAKKSWVEGFIFPGLISMVIIVVSFIPELLDRLVERAIYSGQSNTLKLSVQAAVLFMYSWLAVCMIPAYTAKIVETKPKLKFLAKPLLLISGFGPLLCAITFASYVAEWKKQEMKWDKTEKTGKVAIKK
jgi:cellulose synthase/poly-beta-1,6-N-acetylglucosamine synthase-like glycosyltransferase